MSELKITPASQIKPQRQRWLAKMDGRGIIPLQTGWPSRQPSPRPTPSRPRPRSRACAPAGCARRRQQNGGPLHE